VDGVDAEGGGGEVFGCGGGEGLVKGADEGGVLGFEGVGLWVGGFLCYIVRWALSARLEGGGRGSGRTCEA
jgi:hypothetical protein